ncbi:MAG: hypothetical protein ACHREM_07500 [Polyangiales bacterium]
MQPRGTALTLRSHRRSGLRRTFHDAVLAEGSIPIALTRAKLLGGPIPAPPD